MAEKTIPNVITDKNYVMVDDRKINILMSIDLPRMVVFEEFLTDNECNELIKLADKRLDISNTVDYGTGEIKPHPSRTSSGMFFRRGETKLIESIEERIATVINWPVNHGEGLQILHYKKDQRYLPHNDYFNSTSTSLIARSGNRVATFLMYLATPEAGGSTSFPESGITIPPIKGNAVFFSYESMNASSKTLHSGDPVKIGEKYVATKWLRERVF